MPAIAPTARGERPRSRAPRAGWRMPDAVPRATFPRNHFSPIGCRFPDECGTARHRNTLSRPESAMQRIFIFFAVVLFGLSAAHAQTSGSSIGTDPLSVPAQTLPTSSGGGGGGGAVGGSTAAAAGAGGSISSITAPALTNPQSALQLPGETANASTDGAKVTTRATVSGSSGAPSSQSPSCQAAVPSTDGGSVNLTGIFGGTSSGGC